MQLTPFIAGVIALFVGVAHSVLGEVLIFSKLRENGRIVPTASAGPLRSRNVRILWATWHLATIFGAAFGAVLIRTAFAFELPALHLFVMRAIEVSMLTSGALVFYATNGRHPGWFGLSAVAVVAWFSDVVAR